mmetsp:Transcript_84230/g.168150  ORF Transcript_84230/g.168150 Transcript_84230/m.168150 type:complete len:206 (-) Transcript_84230:279-896(-)
MLRMRWPWICRGGRPPLFQRMWCRRPRSSGGLLSSLLSSSAFRMSSQHPGPRGVAEQCESARGRTLTRPLRDGHRRWRQQWRLWRLRGGPVHRMTRRRQRLVTCCSSRPPLPLALSDGRGRASQECGLATRSRTSGGPAPARVARGAAALRTAPATRGIAGYRVGIGGTTATLRCRRAGSLGSLLVGSRWLASSASSGCRNSAKR